MLIVRGRRRRSGTGIQAGTEPPRRSRHRPDRGQLFNRASGLAEVVIPPRSSLIGERMFPGMVTPAATSSPRGPAARAGLRRGEPLEAGDTLLLQGTWAALDEHLAAPEVLVVDSPDLVRRQAMPMGPGAKQTLVVLGAMVLLLATGLVPAAVAGSSPPAPCCSSES